MLDSHIQIGDSLCLYSLRCVYNKQRTFASGNGTGYLIRKVHVSRSVNQVKDIFFTLIVVFHLDSMALDGNTSFLLQIHIIKHLPVSHLNSVGKLQQAVCQGRFTMVNVGNNAEVAYILHSEFLLFLSFWCAKIRK